MNRHLLTAVTVAGLTLPMLVGLSQASSSTPKRHVTRPISTITVKVVAPEDYARAAKGADPTVTRSGKPAQWIVTTLDTDSCVAWVPANAQPNAATAALDAFVACQRTLQSAGRVARALPACTSEDASTGPSPCVWDCTTMGNRQCGKATRQRQVVAAD